MGKHNEKTKWEGLWCNREGVYSGKVINKHDIPQFARLIVRYNKFYEKDSDRPRFVYCFASGDEAKAITLETDTTKFQLIHELAEVMRQGNHNADSMRLPSETQADAQALMERAIKLVEEITGEEWNFSYLTWG